MLRLFAFILLIFSFNSFAVYTVTQGDSTCLFSEGEDFRPLFLSSTFIDITAARDTLQTLASDTRCDNNVFSSSDKVGNVGLKSIVYYRAYDGRIRDRQGFYYHGSSGCLTESECFAVASSDCKIKDQVVKDFIFNAPNDYPYQCGLPPSQECENSVISSCSAYGGFTSSNFLDDGQGGGLCTGLCTDGTPYPLPDLEPPVCNFENNYCDVATPLSNIDFSSGSTGSSVADSSSSTIENTEYPIDYTPDGAASDPTVPFNEIQADKLINEVVKSSNDNISTSITNTQSTNDTIVEKSDDISSTVSNSANSIIDAINDTTPFYDENIVTAINDLSSSIDSSSSPVDNSGIETKLDGIKNLLGSNSINQIKAPTDVVSSFWVSDYPAGFNTIFDDAKLKFNESDYVQFLSTFNPNLSSGIAANMEFCFNLGSMGNFGCHSLPVDSSIWSAIRIFILVSAGFLCRRIIFGG